MVDDLVAGICAGSGSEHGAPPLRAAAPEWRLTSGRQGGRSVAPVLLQERPNLVVVVGQVKRECPTHFPRSVGCWVARPAKPGRRRTRAALPACRPLGHLDLLPLLGGIRLVLTGSGGVQEETTVLGVPCLTLRTTTEQPVTVAVIAAWAAARRPPADA